MVSDRYVRCPASALVGKLGHEAPLHAFSQARKRLEASDLEGFAAWNRIMVATKDLLNEGVLKIEVQHFGGYVASASRAMPGRLGVGRRSAG